MLQFILFAVVFLVFLVVLLWYLIPGIRRTTNIPGPDPSDKREGNLVDILKYGGLEGYLSWLHATYGDVASFWLFGPTLAVSVASREGINRLSHLFDKPREMFELFKPFVGESILYANGPAGRVRRQIWETAFNSQRLEQFAHPVEELIGGLVSKWSKLARDEHIPLSQYMKAFVMKLSLELGFGPYFKRSDKILDFSRNFEIAWMEMETRFTGDLPEEGSPRHENFVKATQNLRRSLREAVAEFKRDPQKSMALLEPLLTAQQLNSEEVIDDCMTYILKAFSLAMALTWSLYHLAGDKEKQDDLREAFEHHLPEFNNTNRKVKGILCEYVVEAWTSRVNQHVDEEVEGNIIPKGIPIIFALNEAVKSRDSKEEKGDREAENLIFGSSSRRCPANDYSTFVSTLVMKHLLSNFLLSLVSTELIPQAVHHIIRRNEDELWISLEKREK